MRRRERRGDGVPKGVLHIARELPSREEATRFMHEEGLPPATLETRYACGGEVRYVIFRSANGFVTYCFERLCFLDAEEYRHSAVPAVWQPMREGLCKPVYASLRDVRRQIVFEPEYRMYFAHDGEET